jgi:hypothetical protein
MPRRSVNAITLKIEGKMNSIWPVKRIIPFFFIIAMFFSGCWNPFTNLFGNPFGSRGGGGNDSAQPDRVIEPTDKFSLAIGGVAPGRDELVLYDDLGNIKRITGELVCTASDENIVRMEPRPDYDTAAAGSGVRLIALSPGVAAVTCAVGAVALDGVYEITVSPQELIQIILAEAGTQISDEAYRDGDLGENVVALDSISPTANALAWVIRNRIELINHLGDPSIFGVDEFAYDLDPPASYYEEVIWAEKQFSPTDRRNPSYPIFMDADLRSNLSGNWLVAYDQAVITAAGVFNGDIIDPTAGAFGFRSPDDAQWVLLAQALTNGDSEIPEGSGFTNSSFPVLSPIQILIHPEIWTYDDGRPSFVFARERLDGEPAITNNP